MDKDFWQKKWKYNEIGFHEGMPNSLLVANFKNLDLAENNRIFLPLCGKSRDIAWLLSKNYRVAGSEFCQIAIEQLFMELGVVPEITQCVNATCYSSKNIDIFVGDFFDLPKEVLGPVDAIYDRAALVALPEQMRIPYVRHLLEITGVADQMLITCEYNQNQMAGPPFSINSNYVHHLYHDAYRLTLLERAPVPGGLKGICPAIENIWLLIKT